MSATNPTRVVTGEVRLSYANIFEAKSIQGGKPKYSVSLIIPKSDTETLAKIERAIDAAIDAGIGKFDGKRPNKAALKLPLRDGDIERDDEAYANAMFVNANSTTPPQVVGTDLQPILDASEVYSGCYARVSIASTRSTRTATGVSPAGWATSRSCVMANRSEATESAQRPTSEASLPPRTTSSTRRAEKHHERVLFSSAVRKRHHSRGTARRRCPRPHRHQGRLCDCRTAGNPPGSQAHRQAHG